MKHTSLIVVLVLFTAFLASCTDASTTVVPPSWKGFDYVKRLSAGDDESSLGNGDKSILPGDEIKVYAVRKNEGRNIGAISGRFFLRTVLTPENGPDVYDLQEEAAKSEANSTYDGWKDPYAVFTIKNDGARYTHIKVEVGCKFSFKCFGSEDSGVDWSDLTYHEDPYYGSIYTNQTKFSPLNGGEASSAQGGSTDEEVKYHTIYESAIQ